MNNFFVYHNEKKIGQSVLDLGNLEAFTNKNVSGSKNGVVWVVSGVGRRSPKKYYASMAFVIDTEKTGSSPIAGFENSISGKKGIILKKPIEVTGQPWLRELNRTTANFVNGFSKISDPVIISEFENIFSRHGFKP
ncbi:hypothetical protein LZP69_01125 [Shewanella sp. AS1]|uniref:hypothetical protein n=1 Tax=Shewanella sp. AS1 TaxID=2907626 RepID=UPI001F17B1F3|nr:hypothetical protein [Shewanella sp. AS1]MCE9677793.1 hypothetical protein [Shewanella sp. AS1]